MNTEIETKFTNINKEDIRAALKNAGAVLVHSERMLKRTNFYISEFEWIRVRDEGDKITVSYKKEDTYDHLHGIQEVNILVDNFDKASDLLKALGLRQKSYQESLRESWTIGDTQIEIDTWPWIPSFIEIEGQNEASVREVAKMLNLDWKDAKFGPVLTAYREHYDLTSSELNNMQKITFDEQPELFKFKARG